MIARPLNDRECLSRLTEVAARGPDRPDLRDLAGRFRSTAELAAWIRGLPQRDDDGQPSDGPRVACDVEQRARLLADDPNCVERSILYLAAAEILDPRPVRQLATVETPRGRHTFPVEDGEPVVLDALTRSGLRAGVWLIRNGGLEPPLDVAAAHVEPYRILAWVADLAADVAEDRYGPRGAALMGRARKALGALLDGRAISPRDRDAALQALRMAGDVAPLYGKTGRLGVRIARAAVARLLVPVPRRNLKIKPERALYWTGKAVSSYLGVGSLYDVAYQQVLKRQQKATQPRSQPSERGADRAQAERMTDSVSRMERKG